MKEKIMPNKDPEAVIYEKGRKDLFRDLRARASSIEKALDMPAFVYGSLARGDVRPTSDIDLIILEAVPSYRIEIALERANLHPITREIIKASPNGAPKGHIHLDGNTTVSFFIGPFTISEEEFYRFGGLVDAADRTTRVPGVDKRLIFIEPNEEGHLEYGIGGREPEIARRLGIGIGIVNERVRVLLRRDRIGRTGVYLRRELDDDQGFEAVLKGIVDRDNNTRRQVRRGNG